MNAAAWFLIAWAGVTVGACLLLGAVSLAEWWMRR